MKSKWMLAVLIGLLFLLSYRAAVATVSATTNRATYSGNGVTVAFAFPYYFQKSADLKVWTYVVTSGAQTMQTLTTNYTVSGAGVSGGGTVTMLVAPATGTTLVIYDDPDQVQNLSMSDSGPFSAKQIELRLDKLTLLAQRFSNQMARAVHLPEGDASGFNPTLPTTITASAVFMSDPTGKFLVMGAQQASAAQTAQLIGGGNADPLHFHASDRARANHTGTQLAATVSDFSAAVLLVATPGAIGAVTSARTLTAGTGLSGGGDLSADRMFTLANTTVAPAAYGSAILIPTFTVDQQGRLTAAGTIAPAFTTTQLSASANIIGTQLSASANVLYSQLETRTLTAGTGLTGGGTLAADRTFALANTAVTPASYGLAASVPQFTVDAQGRLTAAANVAISGLGDAALTNGAVYLKRDGTVAMTAPLNFAGFSATNFLLEPLASGAIPAASVGNRGRLMFDVTANEFVYSNSTQNIRASENPSMAHAIPIAQNSPTVNFVMTYNGSNSVWAAAGAGSTIAVQSGGSLVTGSPASTLNFNGGLQAGNVAGGVSAASIAAGGVTPAMHSVGTANQFQQTNSAASAVVWVTMSGDVTLADGVATVAASAKGVSVTENANARGNTTTLKLNGLAVSSSAAVAGTTNVTVSSPGGRVSGGYAAVSGSTLTFLPDASNRVYCYEGAVWVEKSIPDAGPTAFTVTSLTADTDYYAYSWDTDGNGTADGWEVVTTAPTTQNGIQVKTGATYRTLIARCRANGSGAITDTASTRLVNNLYNKRVVYLNATDPANTWSYSTAGTWRAANANNANRVGIVSDGKTGVKVYVSANGANSGGDYLILGIGDNVTNANSATLKLAPYGSSALAANLAPVAIFVGVPSAGFHFYQWIEMGSSGTTNWYGDFGVPDYAQSGIYAEVMQ